MRRRILCLYLPDWPIQRLRAARKSRRAKVEGRKSKNGLSDFSLHPSALILHARDPRRGDLVVVCNSAAHQRGVRVGLPLAEAAALACRVGPARETSAGPPSSALPGGGPAAAEAAWSHPTILPHDPAADLAELARLAEYCERFSPIVGWGTVEGRKSNVESQASNNLRSSIFDLRLGCGPDCLFLDVTGIGVLFGGEENLGREVIAEVGRIGYEIRVAIADTIGAGWALTRQQEWSEVQVLSTEYSVPLFRTPHSPLPTLSIAALRLPPETIDLLSQLGIVRLEQLLALPRQSLRARFGELLLLRIDQLLGTAQEMIVPHRPPPQFTEEWLLEYPADRRDLVEQVVRELIHRLATALANRREGVLKLVCRLDCAPGWPVLLEVGLFRPSADKEHLWDLMQMQLGQAALPGPVGRVRLAGTLTAPLENRQSELFVGNQHEAQRQFALLIDRASSRLGREAVLRPQLTADPLPERGVRYRSTKYEVRSTNKAKQSVSSFVLRPLSLFSPPPTLEVLSIAPDGPPVSFRWQSQTHEVAASAGPERIETGWWRGKSVRRDYCRVETTTGQRFWLFRKIGSSEWYLHGEYA